MNYSRERAAADAERTARLWLLAVLGIQFGCQICLLFEALAPLRVVFRTISLGGGLVALGFVPGQAVNHPVQTLIYLMVGWMSLQVPMPTTNSLTSGAAQIGLYLAILSPVLWVPRLRVTGRVLRQVQLLIWGYHLVSSGLGVLQVYFPGQFVFALSQTVRESYGGGESLKVVLADGTLTYRPMGLTDVPGGAAVSGLYAGLFGVGLYLSERRGLLRLLGLVGFALGLFCIFQSHVRSILVILLVSLAVMAVVEGLRNSPLRALELGGLLSVTVVGVYLWAAGVGGQSLVSRFDSLLTEDPTSVYYSNRGVFVEQLFSDYIPSYPFGAGLGRWGMMYSYFGDPNNTVALPLWVEINWSGWVLDGGVPLLLLYAASLGIILLTAAQVSFAHPDPDLRQRGVITLAYSVGVLAATFNSCPFVGQMGFEFWLLNAALLTAAARSARR